VRERPAGYGWPGALLRTLRAVRTRELRLWLGAAFLTLGTVLVAVALAYFAKEPHFSLYGSWQMQSAGAAFIAAFLSFLFAIMGWRIRLRPQRFPDISVTVETTGSAPPVYNVMFGSPPPGILFFYPVHFHNREPERIASIKIALLYAKVDPDRPMGMLEHVFRAPQWQLANAGALNLHPVEFPLNLEPEKSEGGDLVFEMPEWKTMFLARPLQIRIEPEDASTGKRMSFPAERGTYTKSHGLRPSFGKEQVAEQEGRRAGRTAAWKGLLTPPGP
jgi:hypothetical protein